MGIVDPAQDDHDLISSLLCNHTLNDCSVGRTCIFDDVLSHDTSFTCGSEGCYVCLHKDLLPMGPSDAYGTALLFLGGILAGASGIGGGGLNVPLLMLIQGFIFKEAVPISHIMVLGNAIAQNLVNLQRRHPHDRRRPLVDFDVPLLLLPMQLGGNALGVILNPVFPSGLLLALASAILVLAAVKTFIRGVHDCKRERRAAHVKMPPPQGLTDPEGSPPHTPDLRPSPAGHGLSHTRNEPLLDGQHPSNGEAPQLHLTLPAAVQTEAGQQNLLKVFGLVVFWALFVCDYFGVKATGGKKGCSLSFLGWQLALLAAVAVAVVPGAMLARRSSRMRTRLSGDVDWSGTPRLLGALAAAFFIGVIAGLLGLGGGELMAPLLLALGMLPQVGSATSAFMICFTSSSNLIHYLSEGVLSPELGYVAWALCIGFASALVGRIASIACIQRLNHPSLIVFALGSLLVIALGLLLARSLRTPPSWEFSHLC